VLDVGEGWKGDLESHNDFGHSDRMEEAEAQAIFEKFLRRKEVEVGCSLAQMPGSSQRLSKGWALYYQSSAYVDGRQNEDLLVGHGPVVISDDGRLIEGGSLDRDAETLLATG